MNVTNIKLPAVRRAVQQLPWAIQEEKLAAMLEALELHAAGGAFSAAELQARIGARSRGSVAKVAGSIAVLPLFGVIAQRMNLMMEFSGGTSSELFGRDFDAMLNDPDVGAIVIDVDSPGGSVAGTPELAKKIFEARGKKPIIAVADSLMASAAYWIASAADQIVATPSAEGVGSIGVIAVHEEISKAAEMAGVKFTIFRAPEFKGEGNPYEPLSSDASEFIQAQIQEFYGMFVSAIAKHRGVKPAEVRENYGKGRALTAKQALEVGMIDRIATLDEVLADLGGSRSSGTRGRGAATSAGGHKTVLPDVIPTAQDEKDDDAPSCDTCGAKKAKSGDEYRCRACEPDYFDQDEDTDATSEAAAPESINASEPARNGQELHVDNATAAPPGAGTGASATSILAAERTRVARINELCAQENMPQLAAELISSGATEDQAAGRLLTEHRTRRAASPDIRVGADRAADRQFGSFGEQLVAVIQAGKPGGRTDPRLTRVNHQAMQIAAGPTGMNEATGSEGGFFIEPQLMPGVVDPVYAEDPILSRVTRVPLAQGKTGIKYNVVDESSRVDGSRWGGIKMAWLAEGDELDKSKAKLRKMALELKKLGGAAYLTEELMDDAPAAEALLTRAFQTELRFMLAAAIFRGTGAGQPLGFEKSDCKVDVAIEATQTIANSADFLATNTIKMLARIPASLWGEVIWLYNQALLPYLATAKLGGTTVPAFTPAGGATNKPNDAIWGRPAFASEICEAVGTPGDLLAVVPSQYHMIDRGPKSATSMHVRFLFDEMVLKITYRVDGSPVWKEAVSPYKGADKQSPFIRLAVRA